ncbi:hypothetical protein EOC93_05440 [Mesorhizobium sp. M6A.T.Ce.TU.002.03.1.1]|nr:hypothetical protein EOC93_05440 [Mesorhizobium sp. M6A.T.Ce.TU.002.03.1.1]
MPKAGGERPMGRARTEHRSLWPQTLPNGWASPIGTVKNHRRRIYERFGITTAELFFFQHLTKNSSRHSLHPLQ